MFATLCEWGTVEKIEEHIIQIRDNSDSSHRVAQIVNARNEQRCTPLHISILRRSHKLSISSYLYHFKLFETICIEMKRLSVFFLNREQIAI
jgi:hypothetical protein